VTGAAGCRRDGEDLVLTARVTPRAVRDRLVVAEGMLQVRVTAPPVDGKANKALCRLLGKAFGVAPSRVTLEQGESGRIKRVRVHRPTREPDWLPQLLSKSGG